MPTSRHERAFRRAGYRAIAGLDEAGRGALFGPVFAAAVVLDPERPIRGLDDSKLLAPERREILAAAFGSARGPGPWPPPTLSKSTIGTFSRLPAWPCAEPSSDCLLPCDCLLVDAVRVDLPLPQKALIHGDSLCFSIAAASILAKTARDAALQAWDAVFPEYGFKDNKGYGTPGASGRARTAGPHQPASLQLRASSKFQPRLPAVDAAIRSRNQYRARRIIRMSLTPEPAPQPGSQDESPQWAVRKPAVPDDPPGCCACALRSSPSRSAYSSPYFPWVDIWSLNYFSGWLPALENLWDDPTSGAPSRA